MKKILALALAILMIAGSCMAFASCNKEEAEATIKIGLSAPLDGVAAAYGQAVANSAQMAVDEINANGGLNGIKLELIVTNDSHDKNKVDTNYSTMIGKGMQVSLGCVTSGPCLEFAKLSKADNVFFLTPSASSNDVVKENNAYQMCFADGNQGAVAAAYVNSLQEAGTLGKLGVLYKSDDPYSAGIYDQFKAALSANVGLADEDVQVFVGDEATADFTSQVTALSDCDFIFMPIYYTPAANFMSAAIGKVKNSAVYYGCDGFDGIDTAVKGFDITTIPQKVTMLSHFNSKATEGKAYDYIKAYTAKYPDAPLNQFGASAYDCVYALFNAMKAAIDAGKTVDANTSASDMCEILKEQFNGDFSYSGATGENISWESSGFVAKGAIAYEIKAATAQ